MTLTDSIPIEDLPNLLKQRKPHKYGAAQTVSNGIRFASKHEAEDYGRLVIKQQAGQISELELQPRYPLVVNGVLVCTYVADFRYRDEHGALVIADSKSKATAAIRSYRIKKALMKAIYGIEIVEM